MIARRGRHPWCQADTAWPSSSAGTTTPWSAKSEDGGGDQKRAQIVGIVRCYELRCGARLRCHHSTHKCRKIRIQFPPCAFHYPEKVRFKSSPKSISLRYQLRS
ncbi:Uncharacterised protein [Mycobacteroides abscessus subsp. abscessus]|nr:Uncharacterised protein [Mycobacteroides abscessus subsp. abscessus]